MHVQKFGGRGYFGFGDIATFKFGQIYLLDHGLGRAASVGGLMLALPPPYPAYMRNSGQRACFSFRKCFA